MGFFDQIGKKAVETVQGAKDKTTKLSNEVKLKSQLSDKKDRILELNIEIGKEVYSNYLKGIENNSEEINSKCKEISDINNDISRINKELLALKNIKTCSSCGAQMQDNSEFCPKCGAKQVVVTDNVPTNVTEVQNVENNSEEQGDN